MRPIGGTRLNLSVAVLALWAMTARAQTPPTDDAKKLYEDGLSLYALGRYEEAAPKFERAFELKHVPALLYNAAQAHRLAGHTQRAITLYESYLQLYGDPTRRAEIEARIVELRTKLATEKSSPPPAGTVAPTAKPAPTAAPAPLPTPAPQATASSASAPPSSPTTLTASAPEKPKPLMKRRWVWIAGAVAGAVVVGLVVGLGVGLGTASRPPKATYGTIGF